MAYTVEGHITYTCTRGRTATSIELKTLRSHPLRYRYSHFGIYYICSKTPLTENIFPLTLALTLKHNVFELTSFFEKVFRFC